MKMFSVICLWLTCGIGWSQVVESQNPALKKPAMGVIVSINPRKGYEISGLSEYVIKNKIELELRKHGILVDDSSANSYAVTIDYMPITYTNEDGKKGITGYVYKIKVELYKYALLIPDYSYSPDKIPSRVSIYGNGVYGFVSQEKELIQQIEFICLDMNDVFMNNYLKDNPY